MCLGSDACGIKGHFVLFVGFLYVRVIASGNDVHVSECEGTFFHREGRNVRIVICAGGMSSMHACS